ncbi:CARDB domain-containing protein, partial [Streptococcus pneumoniae]|uniref:CARDB domain-containing protein n=1 Tax=Streptococcus pneumoniae TaxID=1313 RepID=UPI00344D7415
MDEYSLTPSNFAPGTQSTLSMKIKNNGRIAVQTLDVGLDLTGDNAKISTIGTGTKKRITSIQPGETQTVEFDLIADTDATVKVHAVPII